MYRISLFIFLVFLTACEGTVGFDDPEELFGGGTDATVPDGLGGLSGAEYYTQSCASCHGEKGEGTAIWPASIVGYAPIAPVVVEGRGTMPGMPLDDGAIEKIQGFLSGMVDSSGSDGSSGPLDGEGLYTRHCSTCHGADASGAALWPSSIQGYDPIEPIVAQGRGTMAKIPISTEEIAMIQDWLVTLAAPADELDGQGLYGRYCASCHGADAAGADAWPGSIQGYEPIEAIVLEGRGSMEPVALSATQAQEIQDWLLTLAPSLSSLSGPEVYDRLCVTCHGEQGAGIADTGPQLRYDDDPYSTFWTRRGRTSQDYAEEMPAYPEGMISDAQMDQMFSWVNEAQRPTSGEGLYDQYCANCHATDGTGGPSGKDIRNDGAGGVVREGKGGSNYGSRTGYMTGWNTAQLSNEEQQLIAAYVNSL